MDVARLVSEVSAVGPGQTFWVALELEIRDGWHTYWRNPGDSGEPTKLAWQLPNGFSAGDIVWTTPHRFEIAPLVNYGYAKHAIHLVQLTAPKDLKAGSAVPLAAKAPPSRNAHGLTVVVARTLDDLMRTPTWLDDL